MILILLVLCIFLVGCTGSYSSSESAPQSGVTIQKKAVFCGNTPEDTIKLKPMNQGETVITRFMVKNMSGRTLHIERIHSGCGCTTASWDKNLPLENGKESEVTLLFNSSGQFGKQFKTIEILSEEGEICKIFLAVEVKY